MVGLVLIGIYGRPSLCIHWGLW